ncbi:helix-turn-helix transcriptional regulator [Actinomadura rudentiformis]|uniref:AAA family ATPase n=1 Tax=Actinomadura rudentiformis TaxID=359158 RepID=A0A6H9YKF0_9ACTN|nr:helix-turn-helix transcriptional regulator [Actinomadura rudentiformis]KAB2347515.1 AAA family ATPase [Actinomadura rudentiformis]
MSVSVVSPVLVGRGAELGELDAAFADVRAGHARALLVGGEAGVGKTRLMREFGRRAGAQGARLLTGGCLELGVDGFPFAPFTAILRQLVREIGADGVAELVGGRTAGLARLLPEFGEPGDDGSGQFQARLFELVLTLVDRLAERGPVVLIIEDAHWADRSSRDLLAFLVRNLGAVAALMIVVTYRSDELHRTHPLRPMLAELDRIDRVGRHELGRLSRREVGELMARLRGVEPAGEQVEAFYARSEGNPLFVEALMEADGRIACELPESLRDLLLAGVQRLPDETQELLRIASAGGARIEHRLLAAVSGLGEDGMTRDLRPAVAGNVLAVDGDGYAFRHALIREALHDDLLPGERTRLHTRYAEALENDRSLVPPGRAAAELAYHWHAAHNVEWALISAWRAAKEADRAAAYAEDLRMLERVLELWERVPDATSKIGEPYDKVLEYAVTAADSAGDSERGIRLATAALREIDDPHRRAFILERRGQMKHRAGHGDWLADLRAAIALIPVEPPTVARARALAGFAQYVFMGRANDDARTASEEALAVAAEVGDPLAEASALQTLACMDDHRAYDSHDTELLDRAEEIAAEHGLEEQRLRAAINRSHFLEGAGRHAESVETARRGMDLAREWGRFRIQGSFLSINYAESLYSLGRWDEALAGIERALESDPPRPHRACLLELSGDILLACGDLEGAARRLALCQETRAWEIDRRLQEFLPMVRLQAELLVAQGKPEEALAHLSELLKHTGRPDDARYAWPCLIVAVRAAESADALTPFIERAKDTAVHGPLQQVQHDTFYAELARLRGENPHWQPIIDGWRRLDQPYSIAKTLVSAAETDAARGDRERAAIRLDEAVTLATGLGATTLRDTAKNLADRIGSGARASSHGLTARELEVLRHLSLGHSNRDIAERLFISAKTASVHVSNILAKLGAANRTEAAATARRLGIGLD